MHQPLFNIYMLSWGWSQRCQIGPDFLPNLATLGGTAPWDWLLTLQKCFGRQRHRACCKTVSAGSVYVDRGSTTTVDGLYRGFNTFKLTPFQNFHIAAYQHTYSDNDCVCNIGQYRRLNQPTDIYQSGSTFNSDEVPRVVHYKFKNI